MLQNLFNQDEKKLNSLTKYPSIETFHKINKKTLLDTLTEDRKLTSKEEVLYFSEKIDGTNTRVLISGNEYIIGSREDLLYGNIQGYIKPQSNDKTINAIIKTGIEIAERILKINSPDPKVLFVLYGETFGGNIGKQCKNYSKSGITDFRLFDSFTIEESDIMTLFEKSIDQISSWRKKGNQPFVSLVELTNISKLYNIHQVPSVMIGKLKEIPTTLQDTYEFIEQFATTKVGLDVIGRSEGIVVRDINRKYIRKLRFEDYEKTFKKMGIIK